MLHCSEVFYCSFKIHIFAKNWKLYTYIFALVLHVVDIYFLAQIFVISLHFRRQFSWIWEYGFFRKLRKFKALVWTPIHVLPSYFYHPLAFVLSTVYMCANTVVATRFSALFLKKRSFCLLPRYYNNWFLSYDLRLETLAESYTYITLEIPQETLSFI